MPRTTKQPSPASSIAALLASLADRFGVRPSDVPAFAPAWPALKKSKVDPASIPHSMINQAGSLWRAAISDSMRKVDELNAAALKRMGDENRVAEGGDVRTVQRRTEPAVVKPKPATAEKPRKAGLEILGSPATILLQAMGAAGFSVSAARAALDELGGIGVSDSTIRSNMHRGAAEDVARLTVEQLAELEPFRDAKPEIKEREKPAPVAAVPPKTMALI